MDKDKISKDTIIPKVLFRNTLGDFRIVEDFCISNCNQLTAQIYLMNDDDTVGKLIWTKEKGLNPSDDDS